MYSSILLIKGAQPNFIEGNVFKTIIPLHFVTLKPFTNNWLKWLDLSDEYEAHLENSLSKIVVKSSLHEAEWEDVLLHLVPSWTQKGTKLDVLYWVKNQPITENEIKKVPSWSEKGTNLIHKKVRYYIAILSLVGEPLSMEDLMKAIGYSNRNTFRENYIKPLEQMKFISKTDLKTINSPDQKYVLTKAGELFLGE